MNEQAVIDLQAGIPFRAFLSQRTSISILNPHPSERAVIKAPIGYQFVIGELRELCIGAGNGSFSYCVGPNGEELWFRCVSNVDLKILFVQYDERWVFNIHDEPTTADRIQPLPHADGEDE